MPLDLGANECVKLSIHVSKGLANVRVVRFAESGENDPIMAEFAVVAPPEKLGQAIREHCDGLLHQVSPYMHIPPEDPDGRWRAALRDLGQAPAAA